MRTTLIKADRETIDGVIKAYADDMLKFGIEPYDPENHIVYILTDDSVFVPYSMLRIEYCVDGVHKGEKHPAMFGMYTPPEFRGKGYMIKLVQAVKWEVFKGTIYAECTPANKPLLLHMGFGDINKQSVDGYAVWPPSILD